MKTAIVLTTIRVPKVLKSYIDNCRCYGHTDVVFIVVGDLKTPSQCLAYLISLRKSGYVFIYLGPQEQNQWLKDHKELRDFLPFNTIQRRNVGYLYASQIGADVIISIDDDNYVLPEIDYIGYHGKVGMIQEVTTISSSSGWVNLCSFLETSPPHQFYHRGFPFNKRWIPATLKTKKVRQRVVVNAGFWLRDPDIDTITRMEEPFIVTKLKMPFDQIGLAVGTSHPFNSQNTAFYKDLLPCMFLITLGKINRHLTINDLRYDDIWMSYFVKKAADKMNDLVRFGNPVVEQRRNLHNNLIDYEREFLPSIMTPKLVDILDDITLSASSYSGLYAELASKLEDNQLGKKILTTIEKQCLQRTVKGMRLWLKSCAKLT